MCTRVFNFNNNKYAITGKNTDWFYPMDCRVYLNPEGKYKQGMSQALANHFKISNKDILTWESRFDSVGYYIYGQLPKIADYNDIEFCSMDGMNSAGLAVSVLADSKSSFKDVKTRGKNKISTIRFSQYLLDCFENVAEAIEQIGKNEFYLFDPGVPNKSDRFAWFHFALSDPSGNSAIIEFEEGIAKIYNNSDYVIMTNQPSYDVQLKIMDYWQYQWTPEEIAPKEDEEVEPVELGDPKLTSTPGGTSSVQRFERASYYHRFVQPLPDSKYAVAQTKGIMSTVTTPMQFSKDENPKDRYTYTIWTTLCDQMNKRYYFQPNQTMNSMYLDLQAQTKSYSQFVQVAKEEKRDVYWLNDSSGDISAQLEKADFPPFSILRN